MKNSEVTLVAIFKYAVTGGKLEELLPPTHFSKGEQMFVSSRIPTVVSIQKLSYVNTAVAVQISILPRQTCPKAEPRTDRTKTIALATAGPDGDLQVSWAAVPS